MSIVIPALSEIEASLRTTVRDLQRDGQGWVLFAISAGWFLSLGVRFVYPAFIPYFNSELEMDWTVAGLLMTGLWGAYALGQLPGGILGDQFGERELLVVGTAIAAGMVFMVSAATNLWMLFTGTIVFGFVTAAYGPTRFTVLTASYPERAGTAIGLTQAAGSIGKAAIPVIAVTVATYFTWRVGFAVVLPFFLGVAVLLWRKVPSRVGQTKPHPDGLSRELGPRLYTEITQYRIPIIVLIQILLGFVYQGFIGFYPTYLITVKQLSPALASTLFGLYFVGATAVQPLAGVGRDRFGSRRMLVALIGLFFASLVLLPFTYGPVPLVILTLFLSSRSGTGLINNTIIAELLPDDIMGTGLGLLRTGWILIGATSPVFIGFFGDRGQFDAAFLLLAGLAGIAFLLALLVPAQNEVGPV